MDPVEASRNGNFASRRFPEGEFFLNGTTLDFLLWRHVCTDTPEMRWMLASVKNNFEIFLFIYLFMTIQFFLGKGIFRKRIRLILNTVHVYLQ